VPTYVVELAFDKDNDRRMEVRPPTVSTCRNFTPREGS
jgi:hypothetical protein